MKIYEINYNELVYTGMWEQMNASRYVKADNTKNAIEMAKKILGIKNKDICFCQELKTIN